MSSTRFLNANGVYSTGHFVADLTETDLVKVALKNLQGKVQNNTENISDLESRIYEIESNGGTGSGVDSTVIDEINGKITNHQTRIETLETDDVLIKNSVTNVNTKVLQNTEYINELNEELNDLTNEFNSYKESNFGIDLAPYDERINTNTTAIADLKGRVIMMCQNIDKIIETRNLLYSSYETSNAELQLIRAAIIAVNNRLSVVENSYATPFLYMCYDGCCLPSVEIVSYEVNEVKEEVISGEAELLPRCQLDRLALTDLNFRIKLCENLLYKDVYIKPNLNECQCNSWSNTMVHTLSGLHNLMITEAITEHLSLMREINTKLTAYENASSIQDALTSIIQRLDALEAKVV